MLLSYLHNRGWRLLYPPQRGWRGASESWGRIYCTVGKIVTQQHLRETYFHHIIGALVMELFGFPFSQQGGKWLRPNPLVYRVTAIELPMGGYGRREVNGRFDRETETQWREQYIKLRRYRRALSFVANWLAWAIWFIEVRGRVPVGDHPMHGALTRRYEREIEDG